MAGIHLIFTGGTIDSYAHADDEDGRIHEHSTIPAYLKSLKLYEPVEFTEICMIDSRTMTENHRQQILRVVEQSQHSRIIITHGTYTLTETANFLQAHLKRGDQTVILVGAFVPIDNGSESDGLFNLGYAFAKAGELAPGVYVCMHGKNFKAGNVKEDTNVWRFVEEN